MSLRQIITFQIPSDPALLSVARTFGIAIARTFGFGAEVADDLRLTLSEICSAAGESDPESRGVIHIGVTWGPDAVRIGCSPVSLSEGDPRWLLISALMQDVQSDPASRELSFAIAR